MLTKNTLKSKIEEAFGLYSGAIAPTMASNQPAISIEQIKRKIDHTLLKPEATYAQIKNLCDEAKQNNFYSVCVASSFVKYAHRQLQDSPVKVVSVVGFPHGNNCTSGKIQEAVSAIKQGVSEIDTVLHLGALKSKDYFYVYADLARLAEKISPIPLKVILETGCLTREEKIAASMIAKLAGAAFLKTSTGFYAGTGATIDDVRLMKKIAGKDLKVKASGGIRTYQQALEMILAGADRLGTSASVEIVNPKQGNLHETHGHSNY